MEQLPLRFFDRNPLVRDARMKADEMRRKAQGNGRL